MFHMKAALVAVKNDAMNKEQGTVNAHENDLLKSTYK